MLQRTLTCPLDRLGLPLLHSVLLNLSASLRAQHGPAGPTAWVNVTGRGPWQGLRHYCFYL